MISDRGRWSVRTLALCALLAACVRLVPATDALTVTWTPLALSPGAARPLVAGLRREPGAALDAVVDTVETPLVTHSAKPLPVRWTGVLRVPRAGSWALGLYTDRPGSLWLGPYRIVEHRGDVSPRLVARSVELAVGDYPVEIRAGAGPGILRTTLVWLPPGDRLSVVPASALAHVENVPPPSVERAPRAPLATAPLALPVLHPLELSNPVLFRWNHAALGTPAFPPLYALDLAGTAEGAQQLVIGATGTVSGTIGGQPFPREPGVSRGIVVVDGPGAHAVALTVLAEGGDLEGLEILSSGEGHLRARDGQLSHGALALAVLALAVLGVSLRGGLTGPDARARRSIAVTALCALALALRLHQHTLVPHPLETEDEMIHHWNGHSILAGTGSRGWSDLPAYAPRTTTFWWGHRLHLVAPFLDWPPLMCLLMGPVDHLAGARSPHDLPLDRTRLFPILLSVLATWLTYKLARQIHGGTLAPLIACALVATLPPAVATARLVKADGLLGALAAGLLLVTLRHRETGSRRSLALAATLAALCVASKQSGLAFGLAAILALMRGGRRRGAIALMLGVGAGAASGPLWGCLLDKDLYYAVQGQMASATCTLANVVSLVSDAAVVDRPFGGGWMLFLWLTFLAPAPGRAGLLKLALAGYTAFIALTTWFPFGWYRLPLYPLLSVLAGGVLAGQLERPRVNVAFVAVLFAVWPALAYRLPLQDASMRLAAGLVTAALTAVPVLAYALRAAPAWLARAGGAALVGAILVGNVAVSLHLPLIDQGLFKDRAPAFEALAVDGKEPHREVRWR